MCFGVCGVVDLYRPGTACFMPRSSLIYYVSTTTSSTILLALTSRHELLSSKLL
jgi:hypothetical protein